MRAVQTPGAVTRRSCSRSVGSPAATSPHALLFPPLLPLAFALLACGDRRVDPALASSASAAPGLGREGSAAVSPAVERYDLDEGPPATLPSGGPWGDCHDGFRISGEPLRDVMRLGLLCGPVTGLRTAKPASTHFLAAHEPLRLEVGLAKRECLRVFATARDPVVLTLSTSPAGGTPHRSRHGGGWVALRAAAPVCTEEAAIVQVFLEADRPTAVAVAAWILPL